MERELALKIEEDLQIDRQLQENRKRQNQALSAPPSNVVVSASVTPSAVTKPKNTVSNQVRAAKEAHNLFSLNIFGPCRWPTCT